MSGEETTNAVIGVVGMFVQVEFSLQGRKTFQGVLVVELVHELVY